MQEHISLTLTYIRLLQQGSQNSISDLDSGRLARSRLIDRLWRGRDS